MKRKKRRFISAVALALSMLFMLPSCTTGNNGSQTTVADTTAEPTAPTSDPASDIVIAESGKTTDFTLVYLQGDDRPALADSFAEAVKTKLGVEFAIKADTEATGGYEIVINSTSRADCKELYDSLSMGYWGVRASQTADSATILVAYKGDIAENAALTYLTSLIDGTSGKLVLPMSDFEKNVAAVTVNENKEKGIIDIYLIAGQSNAVGYSSRGKLKGKFENIWFTYDVDKWRKTGKTSATMVDGDTITYVKSVTAGYGSARGTIGPEYGMAEVLNDYYGGEYPALFLKSAAGGTALNNDSSGQSNDYGNWYPRSLWNGKEVDPVNSPMGVQYYNLVENLKLICAKLKEDGYTPKVRGMVWMQGEADLGREQKYKELLTALITDIREDVAEITNDKDALEMPFVIGKIATTFAYYNNSSVPPFNKVQEQVAASMKNVYTVETSDLIIVGEGGKVLGTDLYHFSTADAETLGIRFAEKLLEHYTAKTEN